MLQLHDYQQRAIDFVMRNHHVFLMMDMGLGKTAVALKAVEKIKRPALVLSPINPAYTVWPKECKKWTPNLKYTILHGKDKDVRLRLKRDLYILNYDGLKWFFKACVDGRFKWDKKFILILDESTHIKDYRTLRFKLLEKMRPLFSNFKMCLSATPAPNGLHEIWSSFKVLDGGKRLLPSYPKFRDTWFVYDVYSRKTYPKPKTKSIIYSAISDITVRLEGSDYVKLPPVMYNAIQLQLPPKLRKMYDQLEKKFLLKLSETTTITAKATETLSMKLRQFLQGGMYVNDKGDYEVIHTLKLDALKELISQNTGKNILCPIQFKFELDMLRKEFGNDIPVIAGESKAKRSAYYIDQWNLGHIPLLLCHPGSLSYGVNMQEEGDIILWYAMTWSLLHYQQLIGRLARQGREKPVVVQHLLFENTMDNVMFQNMARKDADQQGFLKAMKDLSSF